MATFDALFIDFYGTITAGDRDAVALACREIVAGCGLAIDAEVLAIKWGEQFFAMIDQCNHGQFKSLYECELRSLEATLIAMDVAASPEPFVALLEEYWANPPVHADALEFLRGVELPICCVSNADAKPLALAIESLGLRFDQVVCSEDVRCYKPEAGIFEMALTLMDAKASKVMHVGDSLHSDIAGALNMGITSTFIQRENRIHDIGTAQPDFTINSLAKLPALLV